MVEIIKRTDSTENHLDVSYALPKPKSVVIRFGRAFVVVVETSKKTLEIFQTSVEQLREFIESVRLAIAESTKDFFIFELSSFNAYLHADREHFPLKCAPAWKFHVPKQRSCKTITKSDPKLGPLLRITDRLFKQLTGNNTVKAPTSTDKFGAGIPNGHNCCFMASVIQALRFSPSFRTRIKAPELKCMPVVQELLTIYSIIEGKKKGVEKRNLTATEIDHFRKTCIESGFDIDSSNSQEDATHFCQFLLSQIGFEQFQIKERNKHDFQIPVNIFNKDKPLIENHVVFHLANSEVSELKELVQKRKVLVEVERKHVEKDLLERDLLSDEMIAKVQALKEIELVPVEQTMQVYSTDCPRILPVMFERGDYNIITGQTTLNTRKIIPNKHIKFELADRPGEFATYEWTTAVTQERAISTESSQVINKDSGHYAAWANYDNKGKAAYMQFDAGTAQLHTSTSDVAFENIKQNSRILFYEFRGFTKA